MKKKGKRRSRLTLLLLAVTLVLPAAVGAAYFYVPAWGAPPEVKHFASRFPPSRLPLVKTTIGPESKFHPQITNVQIVDFDADGLPDVIACDAKRNRVIWYRQHPRGEWQERPLGGEQEFAGPAHATVVDLDEDGDNDILVSVLGDVWPTDDRVGRVVWLENRGDFRFDTRVLLDDVRRVTDVQPGDLDGDGDLDLVVAVFGFIHGEVLWMENVGDNRFREHPLLTAPGAIHVPVADFDGDGDLDVMTVVTQEEEEVWAFENLGRGKFEPKPRMAYFTTNYDLGGAGLVKTDLDQDGKVDLLLSAGDNLEVTYHYPQPYHGCIWLRNLGDWKFEPRQIGRLGGTYASAPGDLDGDGDLDVVMVSMFNDWMRQGSASVVWLENDGKQDFREWQIADSPTQLCTVACGDLNGDGRDDIVAGHLQLKEPFGNRDRIAAWLSKTGSSP